MWIVCFAVGAHSFFVQLIQQSAKIIDVFSFMLNLQGAGRFVRLYSNLIGYVSSVQSMQ